jgi:ribosome-associated translation inhibitor RaiA
MRYPLQISFRDLAPSRSIAARTHELAAHLDRFSDYITRCHVTVHGPSGHHQHGEPYRVLIDLRVRGRALIVDQESSGHDAQGDVQTALRDAFDAATRRLQEHVRRHDHRRGLRAGAATRTAPAVERRAARA